MIGHQHIKDYFAKAFADGKVNHAYLFEGPKQVGKATFARMLGKTLLCEGFVVTTPSPSLNKEGKELVSPSSKRRGKESCSPLERNGEDFVPCGKCRSCQAYDKHIHQDVLDLNRGEDAHISVESAREFITALSMRPLLGGRRIGIIEEAEDFMVAAGNALLKTLEEPSKSVVLFLITSKELLPTIISRCQKVRFSFVPAIQIEQGIEQSATAKEVAFLSAGRPGRALELQKANAHQEYARQAQAVLKVLQADESGKFSWITEQFGQRGTLAERRESLHEYLNVFEAILRDGLLLRAQSNAEALQHLFMKNELARYAQKVSFSEMTSLLKSIASARQMIYSNVDPRLIAEGMLLTRD